MTTDLTTRRPATDTEDPTDLIAEWSTWQSAEGKAPRTIRERRRLVTAMAREVGRPAHEVTAADIASWLGAKQLLPNTKASYYSYLNMWFTWLAANQVRPDNPLAALRRPRTRLTTPRPIPTAQLEIALNHPTLDSRVRTMLLLAAYQGLRAHEIAKVHSSDFDLERDTMVVQGKGSRTDTLPLHPLVADKARQLAQRGWWFPSQRGGPISGRWVSTVVARELRKIGIDATAHWLRHWFGTTLVRGKVDIRSVQALMRHESLQTTSRYIKANEQGLADALTELPSLIANKPPIDQSDRVPIRRQA